MENKASESCNRDEESCMEEIGIQVRVGKTKQEDERVKPEYANQKNLNCGVMQGLTLKKTKRLSPESESRSSSSAKGKPLDDQLESTKVEIDQVMEENQRLRMHLDHILNDYRTLQVRYRDIIEQDTTKPSQSQDESDEHIALSLGRTSSFYKTKENSRKTTTNNEVFVEEGGALALGLDCKYEAINKPPVETSHKSSPENSVEEVKEEKAGESSWVGKTTKNVRDGGGDEEILQQTPIKRARVSVRIRCDTPTMNDGCQWRKYGQKIAKGNPCPRAYYRCTVAQSCPVRKQVQRCADDMSILITTYEGTHNHPLPVAATAMASTTSAAASMLTSGSSTSGNGLNTSSPATGSLNGLNFYLSDSSRSKPFYLPNASISTSPSFPTITLDLTSSSSNSSSRLSRIGNTFTPRYPTTNLNFSSSETNTLPMTWSNGMLTYGADQSLNRNQDPSSLSFATQPQETLYQSYLQKSITNPRQQSIWPDTIAAATKAITSDPSFQSALASALTSIIGGTGSSGTAASASGNQNSGERSYQFNNVKSSEPFPILSSFPTPASNTNKCLPGFLNKTAVAGNGSSQAGGMMLLSPQFPFSNSKSKSNSPHESRDHAV